MPPQLEQALAARLARNRYRGDSPGLCRLGAALGFTFGLLLARLLGALSLSS
jgi:hypothetical protein